MNPLTYFHIDTAFLRIVGYVKYRAYAYMCFFSPPQLGHNWDREHGLHMTCRNCGKEWWGNL